MGHFSEYIMERNTERVAAVLVAADIDVDKFCKDVMDIFDENSAISEAELLVELGNRNTLGGLSKGAVALGGLTGLGSGVARPIAGVAGEVGRSLGELGRGIASGVRSAWDSTGGQLANHLGGHMRQGAQAERLRQAQNAVFALQKQLQNTGYKDDVLNKTFEPLMKAIAQDLEGNKQVGHQVGSQLTPNQQRSAQSQRTRQPQPRSQQTGNTQISPALSQALDKALAANRGGRPVANPLSTVQYTT